jgi:hypothetical protein
VTPNELLGTSIEKKSASSSRRQSYFPRSINKNPAAAIFFFASRGNLFVLL